MGGTGSGGYRWGQPHLTVDQTFSLDSDLLVRAGIARGHECLALRWGEEAHGAIATSLNGRRAVLLYQIGKCEHEQRLSLVATPCRCGGKRVWFLCPECGRRVRKLYVPFVLTPFSKTFPAFACRHCHRLTYRVRNLRDPLALALARLRRAQAGLTPCESPVSGVPSRPHGTHRRTYVRRLVKLAHARAEVSRELVRKTEHLPALVVRDTRNVEEKK